MKKILANHDTVLTAYKKTMRQSDWYETRSLSWQLRLRRHPLLTLYYALIDRFWKIVIALGLHGSLLSARTFWGDRMMVTFPDYRCIYHHGLIDGRELPVENFLVHLLREGDVCLDVGANVGFYTLLSSALVGESGKVYSFEPTPRTFGILTANTAKKNNVTRINVALMETEGKRKLADYGVEKSGLNAVVQSGDQHEDAEVGMRSTVLSVEATTLDSYCSEHNIRPTFMKIDTEGAEEMVLKGGHTTLAAHHPTLIIEVQREAPENVVAFLAALGYQAYQFVGNAPMPFAIGDTLVCPNLLFMYTSDEKNKAL